MSEPVEPNGAEPIPPAAEGVESPGPATAGAEPTDRFDEGGGSAAASIGEGDFADTGEPRPDRSTYDRMLWAITGGLAGIGVGGVLNRGQSAIGHNPISIGSVTVTHASHGEARSWSGVLTVEMLARMAATYVLRSWDKELDEQLLKRHLLYLSGPAGTGRYTAACLAMNRLHGERVAEILLAPGGRVTEIAGRPDQLTREYGHVLQAAADRRPDPIALATLEGQARDIGARVIVIGDAGEDADLVDFLVRHRPPEMSAVFRAHLTHRLNERGRCLGGCDDCLGACVDRYVTECLGRPMLAAHLSAVTRIADVLVLAEEIGRDGPAGDDLDALLRGRLPARLHQDARQILRTAPGPDAGAVETHGSPEYRRAFRIAYAVFDGEPLTHVFEAADRLVDPGEPAGRRPPLGWEAEALLGDGMVAPGSVDDGPDAGQPRVARLRHPLLASHILDVAWNEWGLSERLLEWLSTLVESPRRSMYERAALVAGSIARYDFAYVYDRLVDRWAGHRRRILRTAAALAVRATAADQQVLPLLSERIRDWVTGPSALRRDSAVRAYVIGLGDVLPYYALNDLRTAAHDRMQRLNGWIAQAVSVTYPSLAPDLVVRALTEWSAPAQPDHVRVHAARALVHLAAHPAPEPRAGWPRLLADAAEGQIQVGALARLWAPALGLPGTSFDAWRRLGYWVSRADGRPDLADWLFTLMRRLCEDGALRYRVGHHLDHVWREQMPQNRFLDRLAALVEGESR